MSVTVAHSATVALALAEGLRPALYLLDIGLPDVDGYELAARLRQRPEGATAIIVAVTGYGRKEDREKGLAAGFDHYFVKPLDTASLMALLSSSPRTRVVSG